MYYNPFMTKKQLQKIAMDVGYKRGTARALSEGNSIPSYEMAKKMFFHGVPLEAWIDIKAYLNGTFDINDFLNDTAKQEAS